MWIYEKKLQFPVDVRCADLRLAKALISQYGGPAGELSACLQYLNPVSYTHLRAHET